MSYQMSVGSSAEDTEVALSWSSPRKRQTVEASSSSQASREDSQSLYRYDTDQDPGKEVQMAGSGGRGRSSSTFRNTVWFCLHVSVTRPLHDGHPSVWHCTQE